jgi:hypothetical protein
MMNKKGEVSVVAVFCIMLIIAAVIPYLFIFGPPQVAEKITDKDYCQSHGAVIVSFHYFDCWNNDEFGDRISSTIETYNLNIWKGEVIAKK